MYEVHEAERKVDPYEVRFNGGRLYCKCESYRIANKIALALNLMSDRENTLDELRLIHAHCMTTN